MSVTFSGRLHRQLGGRFPDPRRGHPTGRSVRRVRHEVRDGLAVVAFSAVASSVLAIVLATLPHLAG